MANPFVHAIVLIAAVVIPGGLLLYLAWAANKRRKRDSQKTVSHPEEARNAFMEMYPPESRRAQSRRQRLYKARKAREFRRRKPPTS